MALNKTQNEIILMINEAKKGFEAYRGEFEKLEAGYQNIISNEKLKELKERRKSHIAPKIIKAKVRKIAISVLKTYFENDEFGKINTSDILGEKTNDDIAKLQLALNEWTTKRINLYTRLKPTIIDALVYGTPYAKIYWKDGLKINRVKIKDLYLDPNAENIYDLQYCVHRIYTTIGRLTKQFGNKKWSKYIGQTNFSPTNRPISTEDIGDATRVEVIDVYRIQDGIWKVSTILPDNTFIRTDEKLKDGLPFILGNIDPQFVPITNFNTVEAYGDSFITPMLALQEEYTIMRNQQLDAIDRQLEPQYFSTKTSGLNEKDLERRKQKVAVSSLSDVREINAPNINQSMFNIDRLDGEMQEVSGITKYNQGINDKRNLNQTATGISILTQEGNDVIEDIIRALNESFFEPMLARMVKLIYKYDTNPLLYDVDRERNIDFTVSVNAGVGAVNKDILINNITTAEGTAMQLVKVHQELQDINGANVYIKVLDQLFIEKLKLLKLKTIIPTILNKEEENEQSVGVGTDTGVPQNGGFSPMGGEYSTEETEPYGSSNGYYGFGQ